MIGTLNHAPSDIIRRLLASLTVGVLPANMTGAAGEWGLFHGSEPDNPDNVITLYDTAGRVEGRTQPDFENVEHPGLQVRVRAVDYNTGYQKAKSIATILDEGIYRDTVVIDSDEYLVQAVTRKGNVLSIGRETPTSSRRLFTVNAIATLWKTN